MRVYIYIYIYIYKHVSSGRAQQLHGEGKLWHSALYCIISHYNTFIVLLLLSYTVTRTLGRCASTQL